MMIEWNKQPFDEAAVRAEIESRNALRRQAGLPALSVYDELAKAHDAHERREFRRFMDSPLKDRVRDKLLARYRRRRGDPTYTPRGLGGGGLAFALHVENHMRKLFDRLRVK